MDLPIALDASLRALLASHAVFSWKIAAERQNLTVILRLRPVHVPSLCHNGLPHVNSVAFRRKSPSQMQRDRQRMQSFRQRDCAEHVSVPGTGLLLPDQSAILVNERSVVLNESQSDTQSIVDDKVSVSDSRANDETASLAASLASAVSVAGTGVTQEDGSDQEVSGAESDADSPESEAATLLSPVTGSPTTSAVRAEVSFEDTARNAVTPAPHADQQTEDGAHGGAASEVDTGSLSLRKYLCQETPPGKGTRQKGGRGWEKQISDTSVRLVNLQDSGVESISHTRDESNVTFGNEEVNLIEGQIGGLEDKGKGGGVREVRLETCDASDNSKQQSVSQGLGLFPYNQTNIHMTPMSYAERAEQNKRLYDYYDYHYAMAVQGAFGPYPSYPAPLPGPSLMMPMPTLPPMSMGYGAESGLVGPSVEVSEYQNFRDCDTDSVGRETLGKKDTGNNVTKGMNENVEHCTKGGKMWSNVVKNGFENNERHGRERRDSYRRDDDRYDRYRGGRGGRGYRDSDRFRGGSTRRARDYMYQDRSARYS